MFNKPILRWTVGNASRYGLDCLDNSINYINKIYKNDFDYFVCYNNIDKNKLNFLSKYPITLIDQHNHINSLQILPLKHPCWKLYPPRININSYEIFIDNDLIIYKKIDLNRFVEENIFFMTEAYKKSYGSFQNLVKLKKNLNSGFFGIPVGFDFKKEINDIICKYKVKWENSHFEEQGLLAFLFQNKNFEIIDLNQIYVCFRNFKKGKNGIHFVGLNNSSLKKYWCYFKGLL